MNKRHVMIPSAAMGREMHLWCYGHFGMPLLVFPSAAGFAHEWDAHSMISSLSHFIGSGKIKVYCTESNVSQSWNHDGDPNERVQQHRRFEHYVVNELKAFIYQDCRSGGLPIAVAGCSLGGFYAANSALKYPEIFNYALCLSGRYNITHFTKGYSNTEIYFNNPIAYVANLEGEHLARVVRQIHISLVCGRGAFEEGCIEETILLGRLLKAKGVPCTVDIWGTESRHDWGWWKRQALEHLNHRFG